MAYLGSANLLYRLGRTLWGWCAAAPPGRPLPPDFAVIAHRGAAMLAPENTIAAFARAVALGANAIETDVCATQDARFLLWHDADPNAMVALARQIGGEGLPYIPDVPALVSPWRQPVHKLALPVLRASWGYVRRATAHVPEAAAAPPAQVAPAVLEDLLTWLQRERRVRHVFFDLKFAPAHTDAALTFLQRLRGCSEQDRLRPALVFHLLSPHAEIVTALLAAARRTPLPAALRLYADFERPGVCQVARQLGVRHVSMGGLLRSWGEFRHEVAQAVAARVRGHLDAVVVWTVNDEARLRELVALGVNGIITDAPRLLRRLVRQQRRRDTAAGSSPTPHHRDRSTAR